jgi:hypothetical protein
LTVVAVLLALAAPSAVGSGPAAAASGRLAVTGGCRSVGSSDAPSGGGPDRATVVVDTGSGAVWSACISFSGTISGIEALERAEAVITDLDPVYDQYSGLGRAVCRLRGVGTDPPDCLGKSVSSWWVSLNGRVTGVGGSSLQIHDGDVEGWRYASGGAAPRPATNGTEAAAAPPVVTTTRPATPTTRPSGGPSGSPDGGGLSGSVGPDGSPSASTTTRPGATTTTRPGQTTTTVEGGTTTTVAKGDGSNVEGVAVEDGAGPSGDDESASGATSSGSNGLAPGGDDDDGGSSAPAVVGFVAVIAVLGGGAYLVRRRRAAAPPAA